jgi:hypothetical protein
MQPDGWEAFFGRHQRTISAIEALSTFAVVVLSLVLALISQRASRTRANPPMGLGRSGLGARYAGVALPNRLWRLYSSATVAGSTGHLANIGSDPRGLS